MDGLGATLKPNRVCLNSDNKPYGKCKSVKGKERLRESRYDVDRVKSSLNHWNTFKYLPVFYTRSFVWMTLTGVHWQSHRYSSKTTAARTFVQVQRVNASLLCIRRALFHIQSSFSYERENIQTSQKSKLKLDATIIDDSKVDLLWLMETVMVWYQQPVFFQGSIRPNGPSPAHMVNDRTLCRSWFGLRHCWLSWVWRFLDGVKSYLGLEPMGVKLIEIYIGHCSVAIA